jgi:hypothetical protein
MSAPPRSARTIRALIAQKARESEIVAASRVFVISPVWLGSEILSIPHLGEGSQVLRWLPQQGQIISTLQVVRHQSAQQLWGRARGQWSDDQLLRSSY